MKRTISGAALLLAAMTPASAADLPGMKDSIASSFANGAATSSARNVWTGFYIGLNGGYGWDDALKFEDAVSAGRDVSVSTKPAGALGGLTVGYDIYTAGVVLGAVADIALANINDDSALVCTEGECAPLDGTLHSTIDWFGTFRGRIGFPVGSALLPYATAGMAYGGVSARGTADTHNFSASENVFGWTGGVGLQWQMSPGWGFSTEWLYVDLGGVGLTGDKVATGAPHNRFDVVRGVLTYKIGQDGRHP